MLFINQLKIRNETLFYTGLFFLLGAIVCLVLIFTTNKQVLGINAFVKPFKFYLSSFVYTWTMAWILYYLNQPKLITAFNLTLILVLSFENIYITYKAFLGQLSHFNVSSSFHATMFSLMAVTISVLTFFTAYVAILFFIKDFPTLSSGYLWGIKLGLLFFVIFAFEGFIMGAKLSHTVGAPDGGPGLPLTNWSKTHGDLRIAHFLGMHALQILPLLGYFFSQYSKVVVLFSILYFMITSYLLFQALNGKALFSH